MRFRWRWTNVHGGTKNIHKNTALISRDKAAISSKDETVTLPASSNNLLTRSSND